MSSDKVSDEALGLACDIIGYMLLKRPDVKRHMVQRGAHLMVIGKDEQTCDIPEFQHICTTDPDSIAFWNWRARGFGGAPEDELSSSCGEENLLALPGDKYEGENILIHEFAHLIHMLGIAEIGARFQRPTRSSVAQRQEKRDCGRTPMRSPTRRSTSPRPCSHSSTATDMPNRPTESTTMSTVVPS